MGKIIICIHGLGNKPSKELLAKWWRLSIREGLIGIGKYIFNPKIEMVYWADLLYEKPLDENITDPDDPFYLNDKFTKSPSEIVIAKQDSRKKVLDFIEKQLDKLFLNEDSTINYGFISDFIIRKYFKDLGIYYDKKTGINGNNICVRDVIREKLSTLLNKYKNEEIFLIAHSMGTIVAYDVLSLQLTDAKINTLITIGSPLGIPIVISKIAAEYKEKFGREFIPSTPENIIKNWYNFSDLRDKVAMNYNLADDYKGNNIGVKVTDFLVTNDYIINGEPNPHKIYGYLRTPGFSKILFEFLVSNRRKITVLIWNLMNKLVIWRLGKKIKYLRKVNPFLLNDTDF
jgi:hypothetical protein